MKKLTIAIDFDGTITNYNAFPHLGTVNQKAKESIQKLYADGHTVIINSNREGEFKIKAIDFLNFHDIPFHYFNENNPSLIREYNNDCRKIGCDIFIDDLSMCGIDWSLLTPLIDFISKQTIICLIGESGTGKTTIANYIENTYGIPQVISRTTRSKRHKDEKGHLFISDSEFDSYSESDIIAKTVFGDKRYCCLQDDISDKCVYTIDEDGLEYFQNNFWDKYNIISIRCARDVEKRIADVDSDRIKRDKDRFKLCRSDFDFVIDVQENHSLTKNGIDEILHSIFSQRVNQFGISLTDSMRF